MPAVGIWGSELRMQRARSLAIAAVAGIVLYVVIDIALAVLRPDVSLIHNPESDYGRGAFAWLMDLNFVLRGALSVAAVAAIDLAAEEPARLRVGLGLVAVWAVASALLAFFPDSPAGRPLTGSGQIHLLLAAVAFVAVSVGVLFLSARTRLEALWQQSRNALGVIAVAAAIAGLVTGRTLDRAAGDGGLYERIFLALTLAWLALALVPVIGSRALSIRAGESRPG